MKLSQNNIKTLCEQIDNRRQRINNDIDRQVDWHVYTDVHWYLRDDVRHQIDRQVCDEIYKHVYNQGK